MSFHGASLSLIASLLLTAVAAQPVAAADATIGRLGIGGTGCPAGTASAALSSDGSTLSIRFTQYRAAAGGASRFDRKACGIAIPFTVPARQSVAIVGVQYRGRNALPPGATASISAEIFFAGGRGPVVSKSFRGPFYGPFGFSTAASATSWSACGASLNLRVNSSIKVTSSGGQTASIGVRSQDVSAALVYELKYRDC